MLKNRSHIVAFTMLLFGISVAAGFHYYGRERTSVSHTTSPQNVGPPASVPDDDWMPSFFTALGERAQIVKLPSLRTTPTMDEKLEMRFWYDARPDIINGLVISRSATGWSAVGIRQVNNRWPSPVIQENLGTPKSGWDALWKQLTEAGILTLPDAQETKCVAEVLDGSGFVVEVIANQKYKTYRYSNPQFADCDEAKRVLSIESILADEFVFPQG